MTGKTLFSLPIPRRLLRGGQRESRIGYANLSLNAGYQLPPLSFGLTESFSRGDNTVLDVTTPLLEPQG